MDLDGAAPSDPRALVERFNAGLRDLARLAGAHMEVSEVNDAWSDALTLAGRLGDATDQLEQIVSYLRSLAEEIASIWVREQEYLADLSQVTRTFAVEHNRLAVWAQIRKSYGRSGTAYVGHCESAGVRPMSWAAWIMVAWAGERQRNDDDLILSFSEDVDHRRARPRHGQPLSDSSLLAEFRRLFFELKGRQLSGGLADHEVVLDPPPAKGVRSTTGAWLPTDLFRPVLSWQCASGRACSSPWTPSELDEWITGNFSHAENPVAARYGVALRGLSDRVQTKLGQVSQQFSPRARELLKSGDPAAIGAAVHELQTRWHFIPGPHAAPDGFVIVCPNFRRCGGVLHPAFSPTDSRNANLQNA